MLPKISAALTQKSATHFAALGDVTRLMLVNKLAASERCSITQLTQGTKLTRQAITKHLEVLEEAGVVQHEWQGRERVFHFNPAAIHDMNEYLELVSKQWDQALARLKAFAEKD